MRVVIGSKPIKIIEGRPRRPPKLIIPDAEAGLASVDYKVKLVQTTIKPLTLEVLASALENGEINAFDLRAGWLLNNRDLWAKILKYYKAFDRMDIITHSALVLNLSGLPQINTVTFRPSSKDDLNSILRYLVDSTKLPCRNINLDLSIFFASKFGNEELASLDAIMRQLAMHDLRCELSPFKSSNIIVWHRILSLVLKKDRNKFSATVLPHQQTAAREVMLPSRKLLECCYAVIDADANVPAINKAKASRVGYTVATQKEREKFKAAAKIKTWSHNPIEDSASIAIVSTEWGFSVRARARSLPPFVLIRYNGVKKPLDALGSRSHSIFVTPQQAIDADVAPQYKTNGFLVDAILKEVGWLSRCNCPYRPPSSFNARVVRLMAQTFYLQLVSAFPSKKSELPDPAVEGYSGTAEQWQKILHQLITKAATLGYSGPASLWEMSTDLIPHEASAKFCSLKETGRPTAMTVAATPPGQDVLLWYGETYDYSGFGVMTRAGDPIKEFAARLQEYRALSITSKQLQVFGLGGLSSSKRPTHILVPAYFDDVKYYLYARDYMVLFARPGAVAGTYLLPAESANQYVNAFTYACTLGAEGAPIRMRLLEDRANPWLLTANMDCALKLAIQNSLITDVELAALICKMESNRSEANHCQPLHIWRDVNSGESIFHLLIKHDRPEALQAALQCEITTYYREGAYESNVLLITDNNCLDLIVCAGRHKNSKVMLGILYKAFARRSDRNMGNFIGVLSDKLRANKNYFLGPKIWPATSLYYLLKFLQSIKDVPANYPDEAKALKDIIACIKPRARRRRSPNASRMEDVPLGKRNKIDNSTVKFPFAAGGIEAGRVQPNKGL